MGEFGQAQSRARGLTRAILDTFPVIKFSRMPDEQVNSSVYPKPADEESGSGSLEMGELPHGNEPTQTPSQDGERPVGTTVAAAAMHAHRNASVDVPSSPGAGSSRQNSVLSPGNVPTSHPEIAVATSPTVLRAGEDSADSPGVMPSAIGRETCPICILDFEDGDDIRVLPCEGHHVFHQACVDPWLLELSSSCPICRHGT